MIPNDSLIKAVCPIYTGSNRKRPELLGSGILLEFGKARFIVTAAHLHDEKHSGSDLFTLVGPQLATPLPKKFIKTSLPASGKRDDDPIDLAFAQFDATAADEIARRWYFLPSTFIDTNDQSSPTASYMFTGYPCSREKTNYKVKQVKPRIFAHSDLATSAAELAKFNLNPETHLAIRFHSSHAHDEAGEPKGLPCPTGMSGGAVWRGDGEPRLWFAQTQVRLVGMGIEHHKGNNLLIGVRIHCVTALIRHRNPELADFLPMRAGIDWEFAAHSHHR